MKLTENELHLLVKEVIEETRNGGGEDMSVTKETTDWGVIYYYSNVCCRFALYAYNDDKDTMYLSNVNVEQSERGGGLGNRILELADSEAKKYGYSVISLKVLKNSWVHDWYAKYGYKDFCLDDDTDYVWMRHNL
jgi:N-acetylglutamate synthase-like GNAT family acetyltransferase